MAVKIVQSEGWHRRIEKSLARELDGHVISEGERSITDVAISNDFFSSLNLSGFKISAIGGRAVLRVDD